MHIYLFRVFDSVFYVPSAFKGHSGVYVYLSSQRLLFHRDPGPQEVFRRIWLLMMDHEISNLGQVGGRPLNWNLAILITTLHQLEGFESRQIYRVLLSSTRWVFRGTKTRTNNIPATSR
ncbi:hypothetical protein TNCV_3024711 [Trichonephila clavipes]|nr:hypothetical protein TNCV_3024711 [Trichonephila clavipes]